MGAATVGSLDDQMALLVADRGYLPIQRSWRDDVESATSGPLVEIETDVVVPIEEPGSASGGESSPLKTSTRIMITASPPSTETSSRFSRMMFM